jgi:hypothetical protein
MNCLSAAPGVPGRGEREIASNVPDAQMRGGAI